MSNIEAYLLIEGENGQAIAGEVESSSYTDQIFLKSWSKLNFKTREASKNNDNGDQVYASNFKIKKNLDKSSPRFLEYFCKNKIFKKATITLIQRTEVNAAMRLIFNDLSLIEFTSSIMDTSEKMDIFEEWEFSFKSMEIIFRGDDNSVDAWQGFGNGKLREVSSFKLKDQRLNKKEKVANLFNTSNYSTTDDYKSNDLDNFDDDVIFGFEK